MSSADESLREQSKLLLRKLKDKQSKLQDILNTSLTENQSTTEARSPPSITYVKSKANKSQAKTPVRKFGSASADKSLQEKTDTSLSKSVLDRSGREGRARYNNLTFGNISPF